MAPRDSPETRPSTYLALEPPPDIRRDLARVMAHLGVRDGVPHVTVVAPPEIPPGDAWPEVVARATSRIAPFAVRLGDVASYDDRVRYLAVEGDGVFALRSALEDTLGLAPRPQPFAAHLTLAAARRRRALPEVDEGEIPASVHRPFVVGALVLFTRRAPGAPYHAERAFPLAGAS